MSSLSHNCVSPLLSLFFFCVRSFLDTVLSHVLQLGCCSSETLFCFGVARWHRRPTHAWNKVTYSNALSPLFVLIHFRCDDSIHFSLFFVRMRLAFHTDTYTASLQLHWNDILWHLHSNVIISQRFFFGSLSECLFFHSIPLRRRFAGEWCAMETMRSRQIRRKYFVYMVTAQLFSELYLYACNIS